MKENEWNLRKVERRKEIEKFSEEYLTELDEESTYATPKNFRMKIREITNSNEKGEGEDDEAQIFIETADTNISAATTEKPKDMVRSLILDSDL